MLSRVMFGLALLLALVVPSVAQDKHAADRITATFGQSQGAAQRSKAATNFPGGLGSFIKVDPEAPIYIEADRLTEVSDGEAVFSGRVELHQGDFLLRTTTLTASYLGRSGQHRDGELKAEQLTRVGAKGGVLITSKKDRVAIGRWATFDAMSNTVLLGGGVTVELTGKDPREFQVATGERLKMDLTTGMFRFDETPTSEQPAGAQIRPQ